MARAVLVNELKQQRPDRFHGIPPPAVAARPREAGLDANPDDNSHADLDDLRLFMTCIMPNG